MVDNGNSTESNYGDTPYPDDGSPWLDAPTSNQVLAVEETEETVTMPSEMIPTGTGGELIRGRDGEARALDPSVESEMPRLRSGIG